MAVARVKHIDIFFTKDQKEEILGLIQKLGVIQLMRLKEIPVVTEQELGREWEDIQEAIDYLEGLSGKKGFLSQRPAFKEKELERLLKEFDLKRVIQELNQIKEGLKSIQIELDKLYSTKNNLSPFEKLHLSLEEVTQTRSTEIILGRINQNQLVKLEGKLKENKLNPYFELINQKDNLDYLLLIYLKKEEENLSSILKSYNFHQIILPKSKNTAAGLILEIDGEISELNIKKEGLWKQINSLLPEKIKLMALADILGNEKKIESVASSLFQTNFVSLISGWIKEKDLARLKKALAGSVDLEVITQDPKRGEDVPVDLENKRLIQPFEFITKIYGMPKYNELDPTPFLAPFFFLYFGFCVSDAGYGFMLALACWFILKRFKMGPQGLRFFRLFFFCGISAIIIGALTGSWFGNLFDLLAKSNQIFLPLKRFKDSLIILDPLKEPTRLLGIALSFGIVQVWFGNIVAAIGNIKNKRYLDVLLDQVPLLTFLFGLTGLGLIFLKLLDKTCLNIFQYAALWSAIVLILTQGRAEKGLGSKLFYGIYNLYMAISGYLSDILSYSRLWALGLVTGVMATTINLLAVQFSQILPSLIPLIDKISFIKIFVSALILVALFVLGHGVSFLMNLLGAFVHPLRLQFVEFFSKFFKPGGRAFRPFKIETKYINIT